jgi:hypothetical protein
MSAELIKSVVDANVYMTLATVDENGRPWASPVFFAASADCLDFYWISSPETRHSRNLAVRPDVSIVIFNSQVTPGGAEDHTVYLAGTADLVDEADVERGLEIYPGPPERGGRRFLPAELRPPGPYRLYRATASQHWVLCPRETGQPCEPHGKSFDHRLAVSL